MVVSIDENDGMVAFYFCGEFVVTSETLEPPRSPIRDQSMSGITLLSMGVTVRSWYILTTWLLLSLIFFSILCNAYCIHSSCDEKLVEQMADCEAINILMKPPVKKKSSNNTQDVRGHTAPGSETERWVVTAVELLVGYCFCCCCA